MQCLLDFLFSLFILSAIRKSQAIVPSEAVGLKSAIDGKVFLSLMADWMCISYLFMIICLAGKSKISESNGDPGQETTKKKGMILPFQPLTMTFHNVKYFVDMPKVFVLKNLLTCTC